MTRDEALRVLGLKEGASIEGIKAAYKEMAQILHPDKFSENKKLQDRATEQFKHVNQAREVLLGKNARSGRAATGTAGSSRQGYYDSGQGSATMLKARLAGIAAARTQLVAQLDAERDSRRIGLMLIGGGGAVALLARRIPAIMALASTALIWGVIQAFRAQASIRALNNHLRELQLQRQAIEKALEEL